MKIPVLNTTRLVFRPFSAQDGEALFDILQQPGILDYFPNSNPPPRERVDRLIANQLSHWEAHGFGWWAVALRQDEAGTPQGLIGWNGLQYLPETDEIEVGYLLARPYWGRGLATEGARLALDFGFTTLGIEEIVGIVHPENGASARVLEKIDMTFTYQAEYFGMQARRYLLSRQDYVAGERTLKGQNL
jgi:ribosomal-protein-alanine N-acetyltransferase